MIDIPSVEQTHSSGAVPRRGVTIVRASGAHLFDGTGRRWIDCSAAHGWAALGHGHRHYGPKEILGKGDCV